MRLSFDSCHRLAQNPPKLASYIASTLNTMLPGGFSAHIPGAFDIVMAGGVETSRNSYMQLSLLPAHLTVMLYVRTMTCASCTGFPPV